MTRTEDNAWYLCTDILMGMVLFRKIAFEHQWWIRRPCDGLLNSPYSVEDINNGAVAWLYSDDAGGLMAGSTMDKAIEWCRKGKIKWGELTE